MPRLLVRSSPNVELKQLSELPPEQRESFADLKTDPDFHGIFLPRPPLSMTLKAVSRDMAGLFARLAAPARIDVDDDLAGLVLDGILEVDDGDGFVSGADALPLLAEAPAPSDPRDAAARLSREALLHAQDLETSDVGALTTALYCYNRIPLSPFWKTRFANREAILAHLGADRGSLRALLERGWTASDTMAGWLSWSPKFAVPRAITYKLYLSPRPERIRDAFESFVRVLADLPGTPFKIGNGPAGLLRPDKMVAYFPSRALLDDAAAALRRELAGCDAHGVPFSAGIDAGGLLSWGVDPPDEERALKWLGRDSWRIWLARRLAGAMSVAKLARTAHAVEPWRFAIERTRRLGVDVESWTPSPSLWSAA